MTMPASPPFPQSQINHSPPIHSYVLCCAFHSLPFNLPPEIGPYFISVPHITSLLSLSFFPVFYHVVYKYTHVSVAIIFFLPYYNVNKS